MPYITEEIYQNLNIASKEKYESICIAEYPTVIDYGLRVAEIKEINCQMEFIIQICKQIRSILGQLSIGRNKNVEVYIISDTQHELLLNYSYIIDALTSIRAKIISKSEKQINTLDFPVSYDERFTSLIQINIKYAINNKDELDKLAVSLQKLENYKASLLQKLENESKLPEEVTKDLKLKLNQTTESIDILSQSIKIFNNN